MLHPQLYCDRCFDDKKLYVIKTQSYDGELVLSPEESQGADMNNV